MDKDYCEANYGNGWMLLSIEGALELNPETPKRCPECHGAVRAHKASVNGMRPHFEHLEAHEGCTRSRGVSFSGRSTPHPNPLD